MFDFGGLFQMIGDSIQNNKNLTWNWWSWNKQKKDRGWQWAREDSQLQRRVEDARKAGVHPLFALGASPNNSQAFPINYGEPPFRSSRGFGELGSAVSDAISGRSQETHEAAIEESKARTRKYNADAAFAEKQMGDSLVARAKQEGNVKQDMLKIVPSQQTGHKPGDPGNVHGNHSFSKTYIITQWGLPIDLPDSDEGPGEAMQNVPLWMWPAVIAHNTTKYGDGWITRFVQEYMYNKAPKYRPHSDLYHKRPYQPGSGNFQDN